MMLTFLLIALAQVTSPNSMNLNGQAPTRFACDGGITCTRAGNTLVINGTPSGGGGVGGNFVSDTVTFAAGKYDATKTVTAAWATAGSAIVCAADGEEASVEGLVVTVISKTSGSFVVRAEPRNGKHTGALPFTCTGN